MKIRFLFYRAKFEWRNFIKTRRIHLVDDAISWWTWFGNIGTGPYSHVEIWTPAERGMFITHPLKASKLNKIEVYTKIHGTCWTSTMRGDNNGTVKRPASEVLKNPKRWDYVEIDIPEDDYSRLIYWMQLEVENNKGYGKRDLLKFFGLGMFADKLRNICSEFTHNAAIVAMLRPFVYLIFTRTNLPHDFYTWPIPAQVAHLSLFFEVVSPRRFSRMLVKHGYKIQRLK